MTSGTPVRRRRRPQAGTETGSRTGTETGAAAVEVALALPLLLLLVFGVVSYGYMLSFRQALSQGASEGARAAAVSALPSDVQKSAQAVAGVNDALGSYGISCQLPSGSTTGSLMRGAVAVGTCGVATATCANQALSSCVSVRVTYDYDRHPLVPEVPGVGVVLPNSLTYTAVAQVG